MDPVIRNLKMRVTTMRITDLSCALTSEGATMCIYVSQYVGEQRVVNYEVAPYNKHNGGRRLLKVSPFANEEESSL